MVDQVGLIGENLGWTVQTAVTLSNTNTTHVDCTNASVVFIETSHKLDINFGSAEADVDDNDIEIPAGAHRMLDENEDLNQGELPRQSRQVVWR